MPEFTYNLGQNVNYNNGVYIVMRKKGLSSFEQSLDTPKYLLKNVVDDTLVDSVPEADLSSATCAQVINAVWPTFVYSGDNNDASLWIKNNIISKMHECDMTSSWGSNEDDSVFTYTMGSMSWTKNRS